SPPARRDGSWPSCRRRTPAACSRGELSLERAVEDRQRELVVADEVDVRPGILDVSELAHGGAPPRARGGWDAGRHQVVRRRPVLELGAVDALAVQLLDVVPERRDAFADPVPLD